MKCLNKTPFILSLAILTIFTAKPAISATSFANTTLVDRQFERTDVAEEDAAAQDVADALAILDADRACSKFVKDDSLGKYGNEIKRAFEGHDFENLMAGTQDLKNTCKRYDQMKRNEKVELWTVILGAMAFYESTCREYVSAQGPNGTLFSFFQLHKGKEPNYDGGKVCRPGDSNPKSGRMMQCTLSMLDRYTGLSGKLFPNRGKGETYWETLQINAKRKMQVPRSLVRSKKIVGDKSNGASLIKVAIREYKYCSSEQ